MAEEIGVIGTPEVSSLAIKDDTAFFVIASDGVWEFLTSQAVVDMVRHFVPKMAQQLVPICAPDPELSPQAGIITTAD